MPGFDEHLRGAAVVGLIVAVVTGGSVYEVYGWEASIMIGVGTFLGVTFSGVLPDIDSDSSIPRRYFVRGLIVAVLGALLHFTGSIEMLLGSGSSILPDLGGGGLYSLVAIAALVYFVTPRIVSEVMPKHRGLLHSLLFWAAIFLSLGLSFRLGLISVPGPGFLTYRVLPAVSIACILGVMVHLTMDGELT